MRDLCGEVSEEDYFIGCIQVNKAVLGKNSLRKNTVDVRMFSITLLTDAVFFSYYY